MNKLKEILFLCGWKSKENKKMSEIDLIGNTVMLGMIVFILLCLFIERFRP